MKGGKCLPISIHPPSQLGLDTSVGVITQIFKSYLIDQSMDHLSASLKRGGIKDLLLFFPPNKRETKYLEEHFRAADLSQVADWWVKKQYAAVKEGIIRELKDMSEADDSEDHVSGNTVFINAVPLIYL